MAHELVMKCDIHPFALPMGVFIAFATSMEHHGGILWGIHFATTYFWRSALFATTLRSELLYFSCFFFLGLAVQWLARCIRSVGGGKRKLRFLIAL